MCRKKWFDVFTWQSRFGKIKRGNLVTSCHVDVLRFISDKYFYYHMNFKKWMRNKEIIFLSKTSGVKSLQRIHLFLGHLTSRGQ